MSALYKHDHLHPDSRLIRFSALDLICEYYELESRLRYCCA